MNGKEQQQAYRPTARTIRIVGVIEPWAAGFEDHVRTLVASDKQRRDFGKQVLPNQSGAFTHELALTSELKNLLGTGDLEVRAVRGEKVLGRQTLRGSGEQTSIGVTLQLALDDVLTALMPQPHASFDVIPEGAIRGLARRVAAIQGVDVLRARAPKAVLAAVRELNDVAGVAAATRAGDRTAEAVFRRTLASGAFGSPGGAPRALNRTLGAAMLGMLGDAVPGRGCGGVLDGARDIVETGFQLDIRDRNRNPVWTRQAHAYVRERMRTAGPYFASVDRALSEPGGRAGRPDGEIGMPLPDDETGYILPPDSPRGRFPEPPDDVGHFGSDLCEMIAVLCIGLFEATLAASLADAYVDLVGSVDAPNNCLCHGNLTANPPSPEFTARPAARLDFGPSLPIGVKLYFWSRVSNSTVELNPTFWSRQEIRFYLPADSRTGFVYLRALAPPPSHESGQLARTCGKIAPDLPHEVLFDRAPAAQISIIYPPDIGSITVGGVAAPPFEFESCTDVAICWRAHLLGEAGLSLPACAEIRVTLRDGAGMVVREGGPSDCANVNRSDDHTYTVEATSLAGGATCGVSSQQTITITRFRAVRLESNQPQPDAANPFGIPILSGTEGAVTIRVSCPAGAGGIAVDLTSSNPQVLQVDSPVNIPEGQMTAQARIVALPQCQTASVTAAANNHRTIGSLAFDVHAEPVLQWATMPPDLRSGDATMVGIDTVCVPDHVNVEWWQAQVDDNGQILPTGQLLRLAQPMHAGGGRFQLQLQGSSIGNWSLFVQIPFRNGIRSAGLGFVVGAQPSFTLNVTPASLDVEWGQAATYDVQAQGQNLAVQPLSVGLGIANVPTGAQADFLDANNQVDATVILSQQNSLQARALRLSTTHAATALGRTNLRITGSSARQVAPPQNRTLVVRRSPGPFQQAAVLRPESDRPFTRQCDNSVWAEIAVPAVNDIRVTFFSSVTGVQLDTGSIRAPYFVFSPHCRVGIALHGAPNFGLAWHNLGFRAAQVAIPGEVGSELSSLWRQFWFSSDDSLLLIVEDVGPGNPPLTHNFRATLHDCTRNHQFDSEQFAAHYNLASGGPPGLAVPMPVFTSIVLEPAGDVVTLTFEVDLNHNTDTETLRL